MLPLVIMNEMKKHYLKCCLFSEDNFDEKEVESRISSSIATVAILTDACLETKDMIFAIQAATFHYKELSNHLGSCCRIVPLPCSSFISQQVLL